jgi:hypothetical protein
MKRAFLMIVTIAALAMPPALADSNDGPTLRSADGQFQLKLPSGWESKDFQLDAVQIGAIDKKNGEYLELVAEDQQNYTDSLNQYAEAKRDTMALSLDNPHMTPGEGLRVNGLDAIRFELHGQLPNTNVSVGYVLTIMKTKAHYIQLIAWTKDSRFAANQAELAGLPAGFSETSAAGK